MIFLTEEAWDYLNEVIGDNYGMSVVLVGSGCSGMSITTDMRDGHDFNTEQVFYISDPKPHDTPKSEDPMNHFIRIILNKEDVDRLEGLKIGYIQEGLNKMIHFHVPKAVHGCGCGTSFTFDE